MSCKETDVLYEGMLLRQQESPIFEEDQQIGRFRLSAMMPRAKVDG